MSVDKWRINTLKWLHHDMLNSGRVMSYFSLTTGCGQHTGPGWHIPGREEGLLFLLALYGSVNHEVGEVNVALGFLCLQHTDWTTVNVIGLMMISNHFLTPAVALHQATSSIFTHAQTHTHVMVTYSRSDWNHHHASKSNQSVTYAWIRAWWDISDTVSVRKHREAAVAETSVTHSHCICATWVMC